MAAYAAQQQLLHAELQTLQDSRLAVNPTTMTSKPQHKLSGVSNGKYFVSPFNRHRSHKDPALSVMLPPPASSAATAAQLQSTNGEFARSSMHRLEIHPNAATVMTTLSSLTTTTTVATTSGMHAQTTASPSLKLRQTPNGGLKLTPVSSSQVTSALSSMKTNGSKPVRVKVQLKVKLPPINPGGQSPLNLQGSPINLQGNEVSVGGAQKKQVIRLRATTTPKSFPQETDSKFAALRKIDIMFAGERAENQEAITESAKSVASGDSIGGEKGHENTLVLRCADGTLCRVPIGGTRKLQKLVATRDNNLEQDVGTEVTGSKTIFLKPCLKKLSRNRSLKPIAKKTVRFAPDTVEVNRESKEGQLQPTIKIGTQLYALKLPSINSLQRAVPSTGERYRVRAVPLRTSSKENLERFKKYNLESIHESEENSSTVTDEELSVTSSSPDTGPERPTAARVRGVLKGYDGINMSQFTDMMRVIVSPTENPGKYVVSKVQDRWKVTIKNS